MKKIMFNDRYGLTEAVIEKRKTVTRRAGGKIRGLEDAIRCGFTRFDYKTTGDLWLHNDTENGFLKYEAPYKVGEIVAVAQRYEFVYSVKELRKLGFLHKKIAKNKMQVKSSLMPRQIRILDVRAERLQDITDEDCLGEGIESLDVYEKVWSKKPRTMYRNPIYKGVLESNPREAFASLIDKISGKGTWERDPYVWRIEFELVK